MMRVSERDRNRLAALILLVRPSHSLAARVQTLNDNDREIYNRYSERMREWIERNDLDDDGERGNAWAMSLHGYGPRPPDAITAALHGPMPKILNSMSDDQAANVYRDYCDAN